MLEFVENAQMVRKSHQLRVQFQNEASQSLFITSLLSLSAPGLAWLAARHGRMDYIWARCVTAIPFVVCIYLAGTGAIQWKTATAAKTLGALVTAAYVIPKASHRRNCAKQVNEFLCDLDKEEGD